LPFTTPGKDHTAHRLSNLFKSQRTAVLLMYALGAFFGLLAMLISDLPTRLAYAVAALAAVAILGAIGLLERAPYERQNRKNQENH
jgi:multidrug transporter EmrE-like cation transporter